jgi:hypothetical protein
MTVAVPSANRAPHPSGLADVLDIVLDKGIVIDAYVRLALVGIEILTLDARVVIASVDTYLHFAEAVNRLDINPAQEPQTLPGLVNELQESGAQHKTKGALSGVADSAKDAMSSLSSHRERREGEPSRRSRNGDGGRTRRSRDDDDRRSGNGDGRRPARRSRSRVEE